MRWQSWLWLLSTCGTIVGAFGTIVGLGMAFRTLTRARAEREGAAKLMASIENVYQSLTTRYLGLFPAFLPEIVKLVDGVRESVQIVCDFPGYGAFTDPAWFLRYRQAIELKLGSGIPVSLTCYNPDKRRQFFNEGFRGRHDWDKWHASELGKKVLREYWKQHQLGGDPVSVEQAMLGDILEEADQRILLGLERATIREMATDLPLYFWLVDERSAIFVFSVRSEIAAEYGFATSDQSLIKALKEMRDRYHRAGDGRVENGAPVTQPHTA